MSSLGIIVCSVATLLCINGAANAKPLAAPCDHRYGAQASWSHMTDTSGRNFYYAEACAFKFNLGMTVFDSPLWPHWRMDIEKRKDACKTGRLRYQVYFLTQRWYDPRMSDAKQTFPWIPDYFNKKWTQAAVDVGFKVNPGTSKPPRFPNHGQELFDISGGKYGYDLKRGIPGKKDVLSGLIKYHRNWVKKHFGYYPSAVSYSNGQCGSAYRVGKYFLGARTSIASDALQYGNSKEGNGILGSNQAVDMSHKAASFLALSTRVCEMKQPKKQAFDYGSELLKKAILLRGWYTDFAHWHSTSPRKEHLNLHDFFESQQAVMKGHDVVALDYGEALQHKFLRDMATVKIKETSRGIKLSVFYKDPYGTLPLETIRIPLSVKVDLSSTSLVGKDIRASKSKGIRKISPNVYIVEVPFPGRQGIVSLYLTEAVGQPEYMDFRLPEIKKVTLEGEILHVEADKLVRLAVFIVPKGKGLGAAKPLCRGNIYRNIHNLKIDKKLAVSQPGANFYIGAITRTKQSILCGPMQFDQ